MARRDIELMLGDKVFLETKVKVKKTMRQKPGPADFSITKRNIKKVRRFETVWE